MTMNRKSRRRADALQRRAHQRASRQSSFSLGSGHLRAALLGTAAAGAMMIAQPNTAHAQAVVVAPGTGACIQVGTTATCTGDLVGGIDANGPAIDTLNVNNLTGDINPPMAGDGIDFDQVMGNNITINSNTAPFSIISNGVGGDGINAYIAGGGGDITINSVGNITANDYGIYAFIGGDGNISITSTGDVLADQNSAIIGVVGGVGNVSIMSTGNITSNNARGLSGYNYGGNVSIVTTGDILADDDGIYAYVDGDGDISINSVGNITTGDDGIFAYVDGDGNISITTTGDILSEEDGIYAGSDGDGDISVMSTGNITTTDGIGIDVDNEGTGNTTIVTVGNISTMGDGNHGIYGNVEGGAGSVSTITSTGDITVNGNNADGIRNDAQNAGDFAVVNLLGGTIQGGGGLGAGVNFPGNPGSMNTLNTSGTVTISSLGGTAVLGDDGDETINNMGTLTTLGTVDLGGGTNAINNMAGATFNVGPVVNIGAGNAFTNDGVFSPGGMGTVAVVDLDGNLVQRGPGTLLTTLNTTARTGDLVNVTGTANLAGTVTVDLENIALGPQQQTILSAAGGVTNNGLGIASGSPALQAQLLFPNANDVALGIDVDFTPPGTALNPNQTNLANNLNASVAAGGGGLDPILRALLLGVTNLAEYKDGLDQLSPEAFLNSEAAALFDAEEFADNFFSCRSGGVEHAFIKEGQCVWLRAEGRFLERDRTSNNVGFDEDSASITLGGQFNVAPNWFVGGGIGYEYSDLDTNTNASVEVDTFQAGGVVKYQSGPLLAAAAIAGGISDNDSRRRLNFGGFGAVARSSYDTSFVAAQLRAAYLLERSGWFVKPQVDVNITYIDRDGTTETGGGAANLRVSGSDDTYFSVTPSVVFGTEITTAGGAIFQPFAKVGVALYEDDSQSVTANFVNAPAGVPSFTASSEIDDVFGEVEAGVSIFHDARGFSLSLSYEGRFSSDTQQHGGAVKGTVKF